MITYEMVDEGIKHGIIKILEKHFLCPRVVCQIGEDCFCLSLDYTTGDHVNNITNFLLDHTRKEIILNILKRLDDIFKDDDNSFRYSYYEDYLRKESKWYAKCENEKSDDV